MSEPKKGVQAAISVLSGSHTRGEPPAEAEPEAGRDLFGVREDPGGATVPAPRAGPGRPPGAQNKRTTKLKDWILALGYTHPAVVLAELASADVKGLAQALECKPIEAAQLKRGAASDLMPYFEQKLPTAIELPPNEGRPAFVLGVIEGVSASGEEGAMTLDDWVEAEFQDVEENQGLSEGDDVRPADVGSHDDD